MSYEEQRLTRCTDIFKQKGRRRSKVTERESLDVWMLMFRRGSRLVLKASDSQKLKEKQTFLFSSSSRL